MKGDRDDLAGMIRWYPSSWRDRYGAELVALIEDDLDGRRPSLGYRASMAKSGLRQRIRTAGIAGDGAAPDVRVKAGALVVLASWAALLLGGAAFAKSSEHYYAAAVLAPGHGQAVIAFDVVTTAAVIGAVLVLVGVIVAVPATVRFLRSGGWSTVRAPVTVAVVASVATAAATVGIADWAHHLTVHQRNGGDIGYGLAILGWALLAAIAVAAWTWAGSALARRVDFDRTTLRIEAGLAVVVAAVVGTVAAAIAAWWAAMARGTAWFLAGTRPGTHPSAVTTQLVAIEVWVVLAAVVAFYGAIRVVASLRIPGSV